MTMRRDFLAFTAGAVAAKTVLPMAAKAEPDAAKSVVQPVAEPIAPHRWPDDLFPPGQHPRLNPHPDLELLLAIAEFEELEHQWDDLINEGSPSYIEDEKERAKATALLREAQLPSLEAICNLRATTLHGMRARVGCILLDNHELSPEEDAQCSSGYTTDRLVAALLRDLMPRSTEA
jgi:hypothetical protein